MSALCFSALTLRLAGRDILHDVSFEVPAGQITALIGESGSGKSMTALAAMQLLPAGAQMRGRITLGDQDLTGLDESALCQIRGRKIGMIFQEPMSALNPLQPIGAQVAETLILHQGLDPRAAMTQAQAVLARVGLPADQFPPDRYPHQLSGGQRQRVVIAIAIAAKPDVVIADEPTTALDVTTQAQILALLRQLVDEDGIGLLMITHDLAVVAQMADMIHVMRRGEIVESAPADRFFRAMQHPYSKALLAASTHQVDLIAPTAAPAPLLCVHDVRRSYGAPGLWRRAVKPALRGVSFDIAAGGRMGLVGESGCGKSTLARAILGLDPIDAGSITLNGAPVWRGGAPNPDIRRQIQVVFQDPFGSFNPRHKVQRLIAEPLHALRGAASLPQGAALRAMIGDALIEVGLRPDDMDRYIHEFSGGQRQRIAIARALLIRPQLIIFDEAVSALDVSVRAQILDLIADISARHGLAYLFITHDLTVVREITDDVLVMRAGQIVESGPTAQVLDAPQHAYTKTLLAAAPRLPQTHPE
jgi:peptide/nickel transport system ATP-binding protein